MAVRTREEKCDGTNPIEEVFAHLDDDTSKILEAFLVDKIDSNRKFKVHIPNDVEFTEVVEKIYMSVRMTRHIRTTSAALMINGKNIHDAIKIVVDSCNFRRENSYVLNDLIDILAMNGSGDANKRTFSVRSYMGEVFFSYALSVVSIEDLLKIASMFYEKDLDDELDEPNRKFIRMINLIHEFPEQPVEWAFELS